MPTYHVAHKVRTVAELYESQLVEGFQLQPFDPNGKPSQEAWEASEQVEAQDFLSAFNASRARLLPLIDALAVVTQCAFSLSGMSFQVFRQTDNPDGILYFRHLRGRKTVGMTLWKEEQRKDVGRLLAIESPSALRYFREAINAATSSACLAMLVTTAESLAGQNTVTGKCENCGHEYKYGGTDRTKLAKILGEDAHNQLYKKSHGSLRNKLLHGKAIDENAAAALCGEVYDRLVGHMTSSLSLQSIEKIDGAPRRFDSLEWFGAFLRSTSKAVIPLREMERDWHAVGEWIDQPENY
jgi:hypothetical protein